MSLGDLDELVISCRTEEARSFVAEAVASYKAGAFRACIVATWIAVVYDLLAKIRELSLSGDAEAQRITTEVANLQPQVAIGNQLAIRKILEIERTIVDVAGAKFAFFEGQQIIDLKRLQDDRNRCAHPTYQGIEAYRPSAELARAHLVHAVQHVLSAPPVQGKAATAHVIRLVESNYFPTDTELAAAQLRSGGLEHPKDSLVRSVVDHLTFGFFEGNPKLKGERRTGVALRATYERFPGLCEHRIRRAINSLGRRLPDQDLALFFSLQRCFAQTWPLLERDNQTRLTELVRQSTDETAVSILPVALEIPAMADVCRNRIALLNGEPLGSLIQSCKHEFAIDRAVDIYCSSGSWEQANERYTDVVEPGIAQLTQDQIRRILRAPGQEGADLVGSHSFSSFVRNVHENQRLPEGELAIMLEENGMGNLLRRLVAERAANG